MHSIVKNSRLPDCDIALATCMFDAGENVNGIGEIGYKDPKFVAYYCITSLLDMDFLSILQYSNRLFV